MPKPIVPKVGGRIMDLQDPTKKMSTSDGTERGTVFLLDEPDVIVKKLKSAVTDSGSEVLAADDKPGVTNLLEIMSVATGRPIVELESQFSGAGYGDFKMAVAEVVVEYVRPVRERYDELLADRGELERLLAVGAARANERAAAKVEVVSNRMGLLAPA